MTRTSISSRPGAQSVRTERPAAASRCSSVPMRPAIAASSALLRFRRAARRSTTTRRPPIRSSARRCGSASPAIPTTNVRFPSRQRTPTDPSTSGWSITRCSSGAAPIAPTRSRQHASRAASTARPRVRAREGDRPWARARPTTSPRRILRRARRPVHRGVAATRAARCRRRWRAPARARSWRPPTASAARADTRWYSRITWTSASDSDRSRSVPRVNSPSCRTRRWLAKLMRSHTASSSTAAWSGSMSPGIRSSSSRSPRSRRGPSSVSSTSGARSGCGSVSRSTTSASRFAGSPPRGCRKLTTMSACACCGRMNASASRSRWSSSHSTWSVV